MRRSMRVGRDGVVSPRYHWAMDMLDVQSADSILEIGCGPGLLAWLICQRLQRGKYAAIDRSALMIAKARKRNAGSIISGTAEFIVRDFAKAELQATRFDKVVAFNVNFFWKNPREELKIIRSVMKTEGSLFVFYQAPYEITVEAAAPIERNLKENGFTVVSTRAKKLLPTSAFCVHAQLHGSS
jgi:SAM-dependent methyltransferase